MRHIADWITRLTPAALLLAACLPIGRSLGAQSLDCDGHFTELVVPAGFCVRIFADSIGPVHQVIIHPSGQVVAALSNAPGLVRLRASAPGGRADQVVRFGPALHGTGLAWRAGWLYFAVDTGIIRYRWPANVDAPSAKGEWITHGQLIGGTDVAHTPRGIAVGTDGAVYVSVGSETDNCQMQDGVAKSTGRWPCPELDRRAGVWRFLPPEDAGGAWTVQRFATGLRDAEALAIDPSTGHLWAATQGRDHLNRLWGWPDTLSANQPAEMLEQVVQNGDYGWPYCQGNWTRQLTILMKAPEYGKQTGIDCSLKIQPVIGFPGHWTPTAIAVVNSAPVAVPHPGLYVAFHGSQSRAPLPEDGQYVLFLPLDENGRPSGTYRIMLHSTAAPGALRPAGIAVSIDGNLYVTDDEHGRIYLIEPHPPRGR